jgi:hypothetical protein
MYLNSEMSFGFDVLCGKCNWLRKWFVEICTFKLFYVPGKVLRKRIWKGICTNVQFYSLPISHSDGGS